MMPLSGSPAQVHEPAFDVLLVEDDTPLAKGLEETLATSPRSSFRVTHVTKLADALSEVDRRHFDVVLLDLNLPDARGTVAPRMIQRAAAEVPIVILTGVEDDQLAEENARAGVQDYLLKREINGDILVRSLRYAMERSRLLNEAKALSIRDDLTGLLNRRGFISSAEQQLRTASRMDKPVLLLFADVDDMKECNDRFGHAAGDKLLLKAARVLRNTFRESDVLARLGGDEFAIMSIGSGEETSGVLVARLTENIEFENATEPEALPISLSVGLAFSEPGEDARLEELMEQADAWMYDHKRRKKLASAVSG